MGTANVLEAVRATPSVSRRGHRHQRQVLREPRMALGLPRERSAGRPRSLQQQQGLRRACQRRLPHLLLQRQSSKRHGVLLATARAGNVIGGGDWASDRLIPDLVRGFRSGEPVLIRRPKSIRPWQHVLEPLSADTSRSPNVFSQENRIPHPPGTSVHGMTLDAWPQWKGSPPPWPNLGR